MKKILILLTSAVLALSAAAGDKKSCGPVAKAIDPPVRPAANWVDLEGESHIIDDIMPSFFEFAGEDPIMYDVKVQQDLNNPGMYRLVNPWANSPFKGIAALMGCTITDNEDFCIEIDATDPDCVHIWPQYSGLDDGDGEAIISSLYPIHDELKSTPEMMAKAQSGTLADNVIAFEAPTSIVMIVDGFGYRTNWNGSFAVILPGGEVPVEYTFEASCKNGLYPDADHNYTYSITLDDDRVPEIKYMLTTDYPNSTVRDRIADEGTAFDPEKDLVINVDGINARKAFLMIATMDKWGDYEEYEIFDVYPPASDQSWHKIGKGTITEDFFASLMKDIEPQTLDVEIEQHNDVDMYFRVKFPFEGWADADKFDLRDDCPGYIYFNFTNAKRPYICSSALGVSRQGVEYIITSQYNNRVEQLGLKLAEGSKQDSGGKWENYIFTIPDPENGAVFIGNSAKKGYLTYVNCSNNPDCDQKKWATDPDYAATVARFLPGKFKLDLSKVLGAGVDTVTADGAETETYYNMQGMPVAQPTPGIYIVRRGSKVTKEYIH